MDGQVGGEHEVDNGPLNIGGVDNRGAMKQNFGALGASSYVEKAIPDDNTTIQPRNERVKEKLKEGEVILGTMM